MTILAEFRERWSRWIVLVWLSALSVQAFSQATFHGLTVAPERRCAPYERSDYPYSQAVERRIVDAIGKVYGPYTGQCFASTRETDIEHIVALSEAHDSGLCAAGEATKLRFASDPLNLTLASPTVNRYEKGASDAADWLPALNACWFVAKTLEVRRKYGLTIDSREAVAVDEMLAQCESTEMIVLDCAFVYPSAAPTRQQRSPPRVSDALERWDDNGNGRITCEEARRHGTAPVPRTHPAYPFMRDADADGTVCE